MDQGSDWARPGTPSKAPAFDPHLEDLEYIDMNGVYPSKTPTQRSHSRLALTSPLRRMRIQEGAAQNNPNQGSPQNTLIRRWRKVKKGTSPEPTETESGQSMDSGYADLPRLGADYMQMTPHGSKTRGRDSGAASPGTYTISRATTKGKDSNPPSPDAYTINAESMYTAVIDSPPYLLPECCPCPTPPACQSSPLTSSLTDREKLETLTCKDTTYESLGAVADLPLPENDSLLPPPLPVRPPSVKKAARGPRMTQTRVSLKSRGSCLGSLQPDDMVQGAGGKVYTVEALVSSLLELTAELDDTSYYNSGGTGASTDLNQSGYRSRSGIQSDLDQTVALPSARKVKRSLADKVSGFISDVTALTPRKRSRPREKVREDNLVHYPTLSDNARGDSLVHYPTLSGRGDYSLYHGQENSLVHYPYPTLSDLHCACADCVFQKEPSGYYFRQYRAQPPVLPYQHQRSHCGVTTHSFMSSHNAPQQTSRVPSEVPAASSMRSNHLSSFRKSAQSVLEKSSSKIRAAYQAAFDRKLAESQGRAERSPQSVLVYGPRYQRQRVRRRGGGGEARRVLWQLDNETVC